MTKEAAGKLGKAKTAAAQASITCRYVPLRAVTYLRQAKTPRRRAARAVTYLCFPLLQASKDAKAKSDELARASKGKDGKKVKEAEQKLKAAQAKEKKATEALGTAKKVRSESWQVAASNGHEGGQRVTASYRATRRTCRYTGFA